MIDAAGPQLQTVNDTLVTVGVATPLPRRPAIEGLGFVPSVSVAFRYSDLMLNESGAIWTPARLAVVGLPYRRVTHVFG